MNGFAWMIMDEYFTVTPEDHKRIVAMLRKTVRPMFEVWYRPRLKRGAYKRSAKARKRKLNRNFQI